MSFSKNILFQTGTQIVGVASGLIISIITARTLGPTGRGDLAEFIATLNFLVFFLGLGIDYSVIYFISNEKSDQNKIINTAFFFTFISLILCIFLWFAEYLFNIDFLFNHSRSFFVVFVIFSFFLINHNGIIYGILAGNKLFRKQQFISISTSISGVLLNSLFFWLVIHFWNDDLFYKYLFFFVSILILQALTGWIVISKFLSYRFSFSFLPKKNFFSLLRMSAFIYLAGVFQYLTYKLDFWIIDLYLGKEALGYYALSFNFSKILLILPASISAVIIPYTSGNNLSEIIERNNKIIRLIVLCVAFICILIFPLLDYIIPFIYGNDFIMSVPLAKFFLISVFFMSVMHILTSFFIGRGKAKFNLIYSLLFLTITLILDLILIPAIGVKGAAISNLTAMFTGTFFLIIIYTKYTNSPFKEIFITKISDIKELLQKIKII